MQYLVTWEIDVEADNHYEAATKALAIQRDVESTATVFTVKDSVTLVPHQLDLLGVEEYNE